MAYCATCMLTKICQSGIILIFFRYIHVAGSLRGSLLSGKLQWTTEFMELRQRKRKRSAVPGIKPWTPGLCSCFSATELWQLDNHQLSLSSICVAQIVLKCPSHTPSSHTVYASSVAIGSVSSSSSVCSATMMACRHKLLISPQCHELKLCR